MATLSSKPIQVYLRQEQLESLRALAVKRQVSVAQLVRDGVDLLLAEIPADQDPLLDIIGLMDEGPSDLAERHDTYLAEMIERENHS